MGHFTGPDVSSLSSPAVHAGMNYHLTTFSLTETASGSTTIAIANVPAGARIADAALNVNTNALALGAAPGFISVQLRTGGTSHGQLIQSASANAQVHLFNPAVGVVGYRATSSSQVWIALTNMPASGTTSTVFSLQLAYDTGKEGD